MRRSRPTRRRIRRPMPRRTVPPVSDTADQSAKDDAAAQISALADDTVAEANIESLIRAKGYEDAVVMLGDGSANIVVAPPDGGLQAEDVAVIRDIVISETGMTAGQIKIVEAS